MSIKTVDVVGAGTMGNGIVQVCAVAGLTVIMQDIAEDAVQRGLGTISTSLDRLIKKEKISADDKATALGNIQTTTSMDDLKDLDIVNAGLSIETDSFLVFELGQTSAMK